MIEVYTAAACSAESAVYTSTEWGDKDSILPALQSRTYFGVRKYLQSRGLWSSLVGSFQELIPGDVLS